MSKGDYLTYRKAVSTSLIGLVFQLVLTLIVFVYASSARGGGADAAGTAAVFLATGLIGWGLLLLVYDQHRRERIEAMEVEQMAVSGASAASAFESSGDELRIAARRLAAIYKWVIPAGALLIGFINVFYGIRSMGDWGGGSTNAEGSGFQLAIGISIAVVGFVFARFVSGMGKEPAWANLRAGSAISVAGALIGAVLGLSAFLELAMGISVGIDWAPNIISIGMIIFGCEIGLNFLLDIYRPRKPGELPRPAFDSRLLGLLAAPDRIAENVGDAVNYQFGIDVTSSWFYQLLSKWIAGFVVLGLGLGWLMSALVVVEPHERGLIITGGDISEPLMSFGDRGDGDIGPGLHVKWPWPISKYETPVLVTRRGTNEDRTTTGVRVLQLASNPPTSGNTGPILWTESHSGQELLNIVQPERLEGALDLNADLDIDQGGALSADALQDADQDVSASSTVAELSLLAVEVPVHYVVRNVRLFDQFAAPGQRDQLLRQIGRRVVTQYLGELAIDEIIATHRTQMPLELKERLVEAYGQLNDGDGPGIEILFVGVNGVHPPTKVAPSFERVIIARQNRESLIEEARKSQITVLTEIAGSVELAEQINEQLYALEAIRRSSGSDSIEYIDAELGVQRLLEQAGGEAGELVLYAGASRWTRHMSERGRASLLSGQVEAYLASPQLYRSEKYFDALLASMKDSRVYLTPADMESLKIRLELQDNEVGTNVFDAEAGAASSEGIE